MRTNRSRKPWAVVAVAVLALVPGLQPAARGASAPAPGGPSEGIKVIGEWTIVVRDEAGREVQRSEFRNALNSQGKPTLASLLSRGRAISEWAILLDNGSATVAGGQQPCGTPADGMTCALVERVTSQLPFSSVDHAVGLSVASDPADPSKMLLTGSRKATNNGGITTVTTMLSLCPPGPPSPSGCATTQEFRFFSGTTDFANPPVVAAGQTIDVTVAFSFQ